MFARTRGSKRIALYSLIIMGIGFVATIPFRDNVWMDLLHGGFEAGLVGGLADWFAVTALFRHPLGIPIPHTALLPNNRNRITKGIVSTVKDSWLSKESIQEKIKGIPFTEKLTSLLAKKIHTAPFKLGMIKVMTRLIAEIDVEKMTPFVKRQLSSALLSLDMSPVLGLMSKKVIQEELDKKMLDRLLDKGALWLNQEQTAYKLGSVAMNALNKIEGDGILQFALKSVKSILSEDKLGGIIQNILMSVLKSVQQEGNPNREALIEYIRAELRGAGENKELKQLVEKWKKQLVEEWDPDEAITENLKMIQKNAANIVEDPEFIDTHLIPVIYRVLDNLKQNSEAIDKWVQNQIAMFVENNHEQIGLLVQENLDKLDNETLVDMVENNIGKDLQWIRVNGAVCGFFIGVILTAIQIIEVII
jgi:uncharacterized membrane-anchored protein YjiN (DUF445 family)